MEWLQFDCLKRTTITIIVIILIIIGILTMLQWHVTL